MTQPMLVRDVAKRLGLTRHGVRYLSLVGRLRGVRTPGGVTVYDSDDVERLVAERNARRQAPTETGATREVVGD